MQPVPPDPPFESSSDFAPTEASWYLGPKPDAAFRRLREEDPVHWYGAGGFWCVTKHADVQAVSQRPRTFSSEHGTQLFEVGRQLPPGVGTGAGTGSIIRMDPPAHNRHRKLVIGAFTPKRVAAMEPWIRGIAKQSLDAVDPDEANAPLDFVDRVAVPLPMFVIADMLGVPREDHATFRRWSDRIIEVGGGVFRLGSGNAIAELVAYLSQVIGERRRAPKEDLISLLVAAEVDGERLDDQEIQGFCLTLLVAGNETTRNLIAGGALALLQHPVQHQALLADPGLLDNAIEEMLRYVSPLRNFIRCAVRDGEMHGKQIRAGDHLALFYSSANRDAAVFGPDADGFDVARESAARHVAFGFGEHFCLGASLARLEARVMFQELLQRWPHFALAGEPTLLPSTLINGVERLPVVLAP